MVACTTCWRFVFTVLFTFTCGYSLIVIESDVNFGFRVVTIIVFCCRKWVCLFVMLDGLCASYFCFVVYIVV